jgi:hypothetical protein
VQDAPPDSQKTAPGTPTPNAPSLRDFDYFKDEVLPAAQSDDWSDLEADLEVRIEKQKARQKRDVSLFVFMVVLLGLGLYLVWGAFYHMVFVFGPATEPRDLGDVSRITPADIPHNAFVSLSGITEHRGMTQGRVRGLGFSREEYWYFRLTGSRGVFVEVLPDKERFGFATYVRVVGRAVDPAKDSSFSTLLDKYHDRFFTDRRPELRIIEVDERPGEGRIPYILAVVLLLSLFGVAVFSVVRLMQGRQILKRLWAERKT